MPHLFIIYSSSLTDVVFVYVEVVTSRISHIATLQLFKDFLENKFRGGQIESFKKRGGQNFNQLLSPAELLRGSTATL